MKCTSVGHGALGVCGQTLPQSPLRLICDVQVQVGQCLSQYREGRERERGRERGEREREREIEGEREREREGRGRKERERGIEAAGRT